ncbi:MAG: phosphate ABC transporter permease subunit PstC [Pseudomonadota bacterium]
MILLILVLAVVGLIAYRTGVHRAVDTVGGLKQIRELHSLPGYYGALTAVWCIGPALLVAIGWLALQPTVLDALVVDQLPVDLRELQGDEADALANDIRQVAAGREIIGDVTPALQAAADRYRNLQTLGRIAMLLVVLGLATAFGWWGTKRIEPTLRARNRVERLVEMLLIACSTVAIFTTLGIVLSVLVEALRFFQSVPLTEFLFGLQWSPQTAIREDQVGASGSFGAIPLFAGTLLISLIALTVAVPLGLMSAIFLAEYASPRLRAIAKPALEILAGIPTVVYGFFAALTVAPFIRDLGQGLGLSVASESALAAGLVMGIMIIPFVSSLSDDVISAVPRGMRDGSLGMGATTSETVIRVVLPAALPGVVGSILLAASRAIGETMIVVMAAGLAANLTANPLEAVTTVTVQIVTLLIGDQEFDSPKTLAAFALGLMLFVVTLMLNVVALQVVKRYREQYE